MGFRAPCVAVALATALLAAGGGPDARASTTGPPWLKLDRVEVTPSFVDDMARVRVFVSAITLEGGTIAVTGKKEWQLQIGSSKKRIPYLAGQWQHVDEDLAVMIVVNTGGDFAEQLPKIEEALKELVQGLPKDAQIGVIGYATEVEGDRKVGNRDRALENLSELETGTESEAVELVSAVRRGVDALRRVKPSKPGRGVRKLVIVVSDGLDVEHGADRFRAVGRKAEREGVRIHTLAWSQHNHRAPMVGLAELSKQSHGTFRLVYTKDSFKPNLRALLQEIQQQYVLTFYVPVADIDGKRVRVIAKDITSNESKAVKPTCGEGDKSCSGGQFCAAAKCTGWGSGGGRGILGWILIIGGVLVGLFFVLVAVGWFLGKRQQRKAGLAALAQAAGTAPAAGAAPTAPAAKPAAPAAAGHSAPGYFVIQGGMHRGKRIPLRNGLRIGKAPDCDLALTDDGFASSHHAQVVIDAGGCTLVDTQSTNGTYVNTMRITQTRLANGMMIKIGNTEMIFEQG
jgi:hypothetical protein